MMHFETVPAQVRLAEMWEIQEVPTKKIQESQLRSSSWRKRKRPSEEIGSAHLPQDTAAN